MFKAFACFALTTTFATPPPQFGVDTVKMSVISKGFEYPTDISLLPLQGKIWLVCEKSGKLKWTNFTTKAQGVIHAFNARTDSELGLLGFAFHPKFPEIPKIYFNWNPSDTGNRRTRISEFELSGETHSKWKLRNERVILEVEQPYSNHNGGQLAFGPDGFLYIGLGDGGSAGDPHGNGQKTDTLLGKMIRIDVNRSESGKNYAVPLDNPFSKNSKYRAEIWAIGLRNPWRFHFDQRGRLIVADVGQNAYEEISIAQKGDNLGWNIREGRQCFSRFKKNCETKEFRDPIFEYSRDFGQSITGGVTYRGKKIPSLKDHYVFADFVSGKFWAIDLDKLPTGKDAVSKSIIHESAGNPVAFALDPEGEIVWADFAHGTINRIEGK